MVQNLLQNRRCNSNGNPLESDSNNYNGYYSGLWLFIDYNNITHLFKPNILPPYATLEKRKIIDDF